MSNVNYFGGEDIVPKGMERHLTYSAEDDQDIFPLYRVAVRDVFQALHNEIEKQIDPECHFADIPFPTNPMIDVSPELLFYLVSYFYARFCYLSPYQRPYFTIEEEDDHIVLFKMVIQKGLCARFPHFKALHQKANRLANIGNFIISIREENNQELLCFRLSSKKRPTMIKLLTYSFAGVVEYVEKAFAAAKEDMGI